MLCLRLAGDVCSHMQQIQQYGPLRCHLMRMHGKSRQWRLQLRWQVCILMAVFAFPKLLHVIHVFVAEPKHSPEKISFFGVHHIGILCKDLQTSLDFYQGTLGISSLLLLTLFTTLYGLKTSVF